MHRIIRLAGRTLLMVLCLGAAVSPALGDSLYRGMNLTTDLEAADIQALGEQLGPNLIRLYISFGNAADDATEEQYFIWLNEALDHVDNDLTPVLQQYGIGVMLSLGTPPGGFIDRNPPKPQMRLFAEAWAQQATITAWELMAQRYRDSSTIVSYQLVSEPAIGSSTGAGLLDWYALQRRLVEVVRTYDTTHPIVLGAEYASPSKLAKIQPNMAYAPYWFSIHMYYPTSFIYQGIDRPALQTSYPSKKANKKGIAKYMQKTIKFMKKAENATIPLIVSEFATSRFAPSGTSTKYLRDVIKLFEKNNYYWTYHAWRDADVWSVELPGTEDTAGQTTARARLLKSYFDK